MNNVSSILNQQIANWTVLYEKIHNYHWFVKGEQFFTLHSKFEEFYNEASHNIDELAERLLTVGGKPIATLKECLEMASIMEATGNEDATKMVQTLADDFKKMIDELAKGMEAAEGENDQATSDMLLGIQSTLQKHVWMLASYLGK